VTQRSELSGEWTFPCFVAGQATAGTVDEWALFIAEFDLLITAVKFIPNAAITANATNFFDLAILNKEAGAGTTSIATRTWAATNSVAFTPESMTLSATAANLLVDAGDLLTLARTVTASGLAMPDATIQVHAKIR
jgi:hypothetical protein